MDARSNGWVGGGQLFFLLYSSELIEIYFLLNHFFRTGPVDPLSKENGPDLSKVDPVVSLGCIFSTLGLFWAEVFCRKPI